MQRASVPRSKLWYPWIFTMEMYQTFVHHLELSQIQPFGIIFPIAKKNKAHPNYFGPNHWGPENMCGPQNHSFPHSKGHFKTVRHSTLLIIVITNWLITGFPVHGYSWIIKIRKSEKSQASIKSHQHRHHFPTSGFSQLPRCHPSESSLAPRPKVPQRRHGRLPRLCDNLGDNILFKKN